MGFVCRGGVFRVGHVREALGREWGTILLKQGKGRQERREDSSVTEIPLNQDLAAFHPKCVTDIKITGVRETRDDPLDVLLS